MSALTDLVAQVERKLDEARASAANDRANLRHETNARKQAEAEVARLRAVLAEKHIDKGAAVEPPDEREPSGGSGGAAAPASPAWTEEDQEYVDAWRSLTDDQRAHVCAVCVMCEAAFGDDAPENGPEHERAMGAALAAIRTHGSAVMPRVVVTAEDVVASLSSAETIETVARILTARLNERAKKGGG